MNKIDQRIDLESAILKLEPRQRKALILWAQGYTQREIGEIMGIPQRTISDVLRNALNLISLKLP